MPNHEDGGRLMEYEEVWRELDYHSGMTSGARSWILESVEPATDTAAAPKAFYARVGKYFLAARRHSQDGNVVYSARRQTSNAETERWDGDYGIATGVMLSGLSYSEEWFRDDEWELGKEVTVNGSQFIVRAIMG